MLVNKELVKVMGARSPEKNSLVVLVCWYFERHDAESESPRRRRNGSRMDVWESEFVCVLSLMCCWACLC